MFQRIMVPLDGSERARQAIPVAARIARASGGSLILFSVLAPSTNLTWQMETGLMLAESQQVKQRELEEELKRLAASEELRGIETITEVVEDLPAQAILERARARAVDLIVLCSHGRSGITRWALGSVAQKISRYSTIPVLILRSGQALTLPVPGSRRVRVLVGLDGSPLAESVLLPAARLSAALSAPLPGELHLVRVLPFSADFEYGQEDTYAKVKRRAKQDAQIYLQKASEKLAQQIDIETHLSIATSLDIAETLLSIAETGEGEGLLRITNSCDMLALSTHGRSGLARWMLGSITERVLDTTHLPLLVVRPQDAGTPATRQKRTIQVAQDELS